MLKICNHLQNETPQILRQKADQVSPEDLEIIYKNYYNTNRYLFFLW